MKNKNDIDVFKHPIKILYHDYDIKATNYKTQFFDISKIEYYDDLMFGEKYLARMFNEYLDFDVLDFMIIHIHTNYQLFIINIRKLKIKKLLKTIK